MRIRWRLLAPLAAVAAAVTLNGIGFIGMLLCRPNEQYAAEHRALGSLATGETRAQSEAVIGRTFEITSSSESELRFRSKIQLPRECRCYPLMINVGEATFRDNRLVDVDVDDAPMVPIVEDYLRSPPVE